MLENGRLVSRRPNPAGPAARFANTRRRAVAFRVARALILFLSSSALFGQGSLTTSDGMRLGLGSNGSVTSLQVNGVEYAGSGMPTGLAYRELPATVSSIVPNGSFESGSSSPTSWSWTNNSAGTWSLDTANKTAGARSIKVSIPGTTMKRSPQLKSSTFTLLPNTPYTMTVQMKTTGLAGGMTLFLVEQRSNGTSVQPHVSSALGTTGWTLSTLRFTTGANAVTGFFKAEIYSGYGSAWIDDLQMSDNFGGRVPVAFGGTVTSDSGGLTQTASASGLTLNARYTSVSGAIRVDATLTDTTGNDRPIEVSYRLPLDVPGWKWHNSISSSAVIADGVRYENIDTSIAKQGRSTHPFATVSGSATSFSLAVPMGPQMQRFGYDTGAGLRSTWDLGLSAAATKTRSKASWTFWIYASPGAWGMRAAAQKYYALDPASFTPAVQLTGAWVLPDDDPADVANSQDFGWGFIEGDGISEIDFGNARGIPVYHYIFPNGWFYDFPDGAQPSYDTLINKLNSLAASGTGTTVNGTPTKEMAQAIINSSPYNAQGLYAVQDNYYYWYKNYIQIYPGFPDPDIPAPSLWSVLKRDAVDDRIALWQGRGNHLDGIFLDNMSYIFQSQENHRKALWAYTDFPLSFSYASRKVMQYGGNAIAEYCKALHAYVAPKGMGLMGSGASADMMWVAPWLDIIGGEVDTGALGPGAYVRRVISYGKGWTNLYVPPAGTGAPAAADVLAYLRQGLLMGFFPGMNGSYWNVPSAYERDRANFKKYMPLIKKAVAAGWRPVTYAVPSDAAILVERFDDETGGTFYLTSQNSSTSTKSFQLTVDGAALGAGSGAVTVKDLVSGATLSASRSGSNILFSDTLATGETALYEMTVASGCDATYGDLNQDGRTDATDLVILSHYLVGNIAAGSAPFTAPLAKADLDRSGTVDAVDLVVLQNYLAGNVACLPK